MESSSQDVSPVRTLVFAILPPVEDLAKMALGSGMKNTGLRVKNGARHMTNAPRYRTSCYAEER